MRKFQDIVFIWTQAYTEIFRSAFSVPLKSPGRLLTASGHGFHLFDKGIQIRLIPLHKGLLLDLLIFLLYMLQSAYCSKYSAMTTNFYILNVFLRFLHQFVWKHFRIFVTVMRSISSKVFHEGNFEENFILSCGLLLAWFNMLDINSISVIICFYSQRDICSLKLWRWYQPRT